MTPARERGAPGTCGCPLADLWTADLAHLCTTTPDVLTPVAAYYEALCPPERGCTDGIAHRCEGTGWHTASGGTVAGWYARHPAGVAMAQTSGHAA